MFHENLSGFVPWMQSAVSRTNVLRYSRTDKQSPWSLPKKMSWLLLQKNATVNTCFCKSSCLVLPSSPSSEQGQRGSFKRNFKVHSGLWFLISSFVMDREQNVVLFLIFYHLWHIIFLKLNVSGTSLNSGRRVKNGH